EDEDQQLKTSHARCSSGAAILLSEYLRDIDVAGGNLPGHCKSNNRDKPADNLPGEQLQEHERRRVDRHLCSPFRHGSDCCAFRGTYCQGKAPGCRQKTAANSEGFLEIFAGCSKPG